jgi:hypothetical protein
LRFYYFPESFLHQFLLQLHLFLKLFLNCAFGEL